ncbi:MAG: hypothetical protein GY769_17755 [bacterium]|nr:hypothetical protein [bacterium]
MAATKKSESENREIEAKIADDRLLRFAESKSSRRRVVLLELNLPKPTLSLGKVRRVGGVQIRRRSLKLSEAQRRKIKDATARVQRDLESAGVEGKLLRSSGVILAKVYPDQLRQVADSSLIKAIHPNRKYS